MLDDLLTLRGTRCRPGRAPRQWRRSRVRPGGRFGTFGSEVRALAPW